MHVSVTEVLDLLQGLTNDKATVMDGLSGESLNFADPMLALLLSICFTCMFRHSHLPVSMLHSVVVRMPCQQFQKVDFTCRIQQITCTFKK